MVDFLYSQNLYLNPVFQNKYLFYYLAIHRQNQAAQKKTYANSFFPLLSLLSIQNDLSVISCNWSIFATLPYPNKAETPFNMCVCVCEWKDHYKALKVSWLYKCNVKKQHTHNRGENFEDENDWRRTVRLCRQATPSQLLKAFGNEL